MKRREGESFEKYQVRRWTENYKTRNYLSGRMVVQGTEENRATRRAIVNRSKHYGSHDKYAGSMR